MANDVVGWVEALSPAVIAGLAAWVAVKIENAVLRTRIDAVEDRLKEINAVLVSLADYKAQLAVLEQRLLMQGARIDEEKRRNDGLAVDLRAIMLDKAYGKTRPDQNPRSRTEP